MQSLSKGKLYVISGPSGAGKGTVCKRIASSHPEIHLSVSMTTREPREGEVDGREYYFTSIQDFETRIEQEKFLEYAKVYSNYYGTPKDKVEQELQLGKDILLEIDIQGGLQIKRIFKEAILIFLLPMSLERLRQQLISRNTDRAGVIEERLALARQEIEFASKYDYYVINDVIDETIAQIESIIASEHHRVDEQIFSVINQYN